MNIPYKQCSWFSLNWAKSAIQPSCPINTLAARISKKMYMYSKSLQHNVCSCIGLVESFYNFVQNSLSILCNDRQVAIAAMKQSWVANWRFIGKFCSISDQASFYHFVQNSLSILCNDRQGAISDIKQSWVANWQFIGKFL